MWTIYRHFCKPSGKSYVGQTVGTLDWRARKNGSGYKNNNKLIAAIKKYGWDNFDHEILETNIPTQELANEKEQYWITYYDSIKNGYNILPGGQIDNSDIFRKIYQIDSEKNIIAKFKSAMDANRNLFPETPFWHAREITKCCRGERNNVDGKYFCFVDEYDTYEIKQIKGSYSIILQLDKNKTIINKYNSLTDAHLKTGINLAHIKDCCDGNRKTAGGFFWCYEINYKNYEIPEVEDWPVAKVVNQIDINTGKIINTYQSANIASKETGISRGNINTCCRGEIKSAGGYKWEFKETYNKEIDYMEKEQVKKFDLEAAFKALEEIETPEVKEGPRANRVNLKETFNSKSAHEVLVEDYYDLTDNEELEQAAEDRESEVAKAKLARIEKIVDLDADTADELLPSYVGKVIIQCPQCMTLFYKNPEDIEHSEENPDVVNINEICQHCGNSSGYTLIGKVDKVGEDEAENYDVEDFEENELDLDFEEPTEEETEEEPAEEETTEESEEEINLDEVPLEEPEEEEEKKEESLEASTENVQLNESADDPVEDAPVEDEQVDEEPTDEPVEEAQPIETTVEEVKEIATEVANKVAEPVKDEEAAKEQQEEIKEIVDETVEEKLGEEKPEEGKEAEEVIEEEPAVEEGYTGNPAERTTHLEYTDDDPTDGKAVLPDNIEKQLTEGEEDEGNDAWKALSNRPKGNYALVKENPKLWRGTEKYIIYGSDKDAKVLVTKEISNDSGKAADIKVIRDEVLNSDDNIIDVFVSRIYKNTETGEELEVELDSYTDSKDWSVGIGESLTEGADDALIDSIIASWGDVTENLDETLDDDLDKLLDSDEFKTPVSDAEIGMGENLEECDGKDCKEPIEECNKTLPESVEDEIKSIMDSWDTNLDDDDKKVDAPVDEEPVPANSKEAADAVGRIMSAWKFDEAIEDLDEASFNEHINGYLTEVYSNVKEFEATSCELNEGKLIVEGNITFNSGKVKTTKFEFTPESETVLEGYNKDFSDEKAFKLNYKLDEAKNLITESLSYKYKINESLVEGLK